MEIFQNIWNALTHENEVLTKLINIPFTFIELYLAMLIFTYFLKINYSKKQGFIFVLSLSLIGIITFYLLPNPYNTFINIIMLPIMILIVFKTSLLVAVLSEILQYLIFLVVGTLWVNVYTLIFQVTSEQLIVVPIHKILYSISLYSLLLIIYCILKKSNHKIIKTIKEHNNKFTLLLNFIVGTIAIALDSLIMTKYIDVVAFPLVVMNILILVIYFVISIYSLFRTAKLEETTENLEEQKLYNKTLTILYDNIRGFKHDFNNIVQAIGGYVSSNNIDGLKNYYTELLKDCQEANNLTILNPEIINNPAIYSLLTSKYHKATERGIKVNVEAFLDLTTLNINIYEFTRILGILLDNAIEASSNSTEKLINVVIRKDAKVNRSLFIIENTYSNKNVDIDKIFNKGYTSKGESDAKNHGIGLWEVRKILNRSNNLNLYTTKNDTFFTQQLEIYN